MQTYQIIDLDGCISDDRWRRNLIQPSLIGQARFDAYHDLCHKDLALNLNAVIPGHAIIVITGRPTRVRERTEVWLREVAGLQISLMIMRNDDETKPAPDLKRMMVSWLFDANLYGFLPEQVVSAIDDRADVVELYRRDFGLNSRVVRIGDEEHEHA